uniref:BTB domain-containing protein n=2 Tax=Meloidogyne TaxID=189290 RepID=A0A6V7UAA7_MELEN|nr:unnamed protein product [Meloidogyne enterolobii]
MFFDVSDKLDLIKCKIEWKIYDLKLRKEFLGEKHMTSKNFYNPKCPSVVWELRVYQYLNCASTYVSLTQTGLKESKVNLCAKYDIYAYDIVGKLVNICLPNSTTFGHKTETDKSNINLEKICHADGSILLYCEVEFVPHNIKCENNQISIYQIEKRNLLEDLFLDRTLSDFVIKIGDEKINVHRCILAQNSNVFLTMFKQKDMIEAKNGELEIVDSSPECFKAMIEYFYLGKINSSNLLENNIDELYALANKYEVYFFDV